MSPYPSQRPLPTYTHHPRRVKFERMTGENLQAIKSTFDQRIKDSRIEALRHYNWQRSKLQLAERVTGSQPRVSLPLDNDPDATVSTNAISPHSDPALMIARKPSQAGTHNLNLITLPNEIRSCINPERVPDAIVLNPKTAYALAGVGQLHEGHFLYYSVLIEVQLSTRIPTDKFFLMY